VRGVGLAIALLLIAAGIYWLGGRDNRAVDQINTLVREKDISDAIKDNDAAPSWRGKLLQRD
jgi:hypothetical protein